MITFRSALFNKPIVYLTQVLFILFASWSDPSISVVVGALMLNSSVCNTAVLSVTFLIYIYLLQRLKDEIAEVTCEIENLGSTEER